MRCLLDTRRVVQPIGISPIGHQLAESYGLQVRAGMVFHVGLAVKRGGGLLFKRSYGFLL
jgi:hypothetical protein